MSLPTPLVASAGSPRRKRTPNGCDKPVALRLPPDERSELQRLADQQRISMAAVARACVVRGLASFKRDAAQARAGELNG